MFRKIGFLSVAVLATSVAQAAIIEDFESGAFGSEWIGTGGTTSTSSSFARDGTYGGSTNGNWYYRTDAAATLGSDSSISVWFKARPGDTVTSAGGIRIGFGASASGASSFGAGGFWNNDNYGNTQLTTTTVDAGSGTTNLTPGYWYRLAVSFGPTIIGGIYFGANDTQISRSFTATGLNHGASGGIAIYSTAGRGFDSLSLINPGVSAVPEPESWVMLAIGFCLMGATRRRLD
jgi:hypothetical protein